MNKSEIGFPRSSKMGKDEWLTPPELIKSLGSFDLDPCSPISRPWNTAKNHFTIADDGLNHHWEGRVWLNPPYGKFTGIWLEKLYLHGNGIALIFARTETKMFFDWVWKRSGAVKFLEGRLSFYHVSGVRAKSYGGAPSVLVAYGDNNVEALRNNVLKGKFIKL
jgi:hypothetical protein